MASHASAHQPAADRQSWGAILSRMVFALIVVALLVAYGASYTVQEGTSAIVTRFGRPVQVRTEPGFYGKWPWPIEQVHAIDMRYRYYNTPFSATFTRDRKNIVLATYVVWRVDNPLLFFQAIGTPDEAEKKLDGIVSAAKNFQMGNYELASLVSTVPGEIRTPEIEERVLAYVQERTEKPFGVAIEQVGVKRIAYPEENMEAVLEQMRAERRSEAGELRPKGTKEAQAIRNEGMVQAEQILRAAREEAGTIVGRAEQQAAEAYAKAHQLDPDFYRFWRSMQVIRNTLGAKSTVILRSDQEPFRELFESSPTGSSPRSDAAGRPVLVPATTPGVAP
ncbi:MAG: protease modulator HflC [Patescibacteria group bacterium]|nr:protease modulator HflC [Patescibacteria group bacterium]